MSDATTRPILLCLPTSGTGGNPWPWRVAMSIVSIYWHVDLRQVACRHSFPHANGVNIIYLNLLWRFCQWMLKGKLLIYHLLTDNPHASLLKIWPLKYWLVLISKRNFHFVPKKIHLTIVSSSGKLWTTLSWWLPHKHMNYELYRMVRQVHQAHY